MENFGILCGMLFWGPVILVWIAYLRKGQMSKLERSIGSLIVFGLPTLAAISMFALDPGESQYYPAFLEEALNSNNVAMVKQYLDKGADPNLEIKGDSLLAEASANGQEEIVQLLLAHGANVNAIGSRNRRTALATAQNHGYKNIVKLLKDAGATH